MPPPCTQLEEQRGQRQLQKAFADALKHATAPSPDLEIITLLLDSGASPADLHCASLFDLDDLSLNDAFGFCSEIYKDTKPLQKEKAPDEDPDGTALATVADPLDKASAYLRTLQAHAPTELATHTYAYEVATRKKKYLLALRGLLKAQAIAPADEGVKARVKAFLKETEAAELPPLVAKVVAQSRAKLAAAA